MTPTLHVFGKFCSHAPNFLIYAIFGDYRGAWPNHSQLALEIFFSSFIFVYTLRARKKATWRHVTPKAVWQVLLLSSVRRPHKAAECLQGCRPKFLNIGGNIYFHRGFGVHQKRIFLRGLNNARRFSHSLCKRLKLAAADRMLDEQRRMAIFFYLSLFFRKANGSAFFFYQSHRDKSENLQIQMLNLFTCSISVVLLLPIIHIAFRKFLLHFINQIKFDISHLDYKNKEVKKKKTENWSWEKTIARLFNSKLVFLVKKKNQVHPFS